MYVVKVVYGACLGAHPFLCKHDDVLHEEVVEVAGVYAVPERQVDERAEL